MAAEQATKIQDWKSLTVDDCAYVPVCPTASLPNKLYRMQSSNSQADVAFNFAQLCLLFVVFVRICAAFLTSPSGFNPTGLLSLNLGLFVYLLSIPTFLGE